MKLHPSVSPIKEKHLLLWDEDGKPLYPAVVWQCKRSVQVCEQLKEKGLSDNGTTKNRTGN